MKVQIRGFYSDGSGREGDVLLERTTVIGSGADGDTDAEREAAMNEIWAAKEALEKAQGSYSHYLVVLQGDEE